MFITSKSISKKKIPAGIHWYRQWLGSVDHFDRYLHLYSHNHRHIKWTQALLDGLLKMAVNNTFIIAKYLRLTNTLKETTQVLIDQLSKNHITRTAIPKPSHIMSANDTFHMPIYSNKTSPCIYCQSQQKKTNTPYYCSTCRVYLHPKCFVFYHLSSK